MPWGDAAWVARCPGWAPRLLRFARSLSDRHIGAVQGGRGSPGRGTLAGVQGGCGRRGGSGCAAGQHLLAIASLTPCWEARVCRGQVVGASGWRGQLLSREWSWDLRCKEGGWAVLSGFCLLGDGASRIPASSLARLPSRSGKGWQWGAGSSRCSEEGLQPSSDSARLRGRMMPGCPVGPSPGRGCGRVTPH